MGKALVVPGANFSTNKLATVTFITPVPCTGISLSASTAAMTKVGSMVTLTAAVTPADTTESVIWTSSDAQIVEVVGGTLIQHGVGIATITATCGSYSASCTVTCTMVYNGNNDLYKIVNGAGYKPSDAADFLKYVAANGYIQYISKSEYGYPVFFNQSSLAEQYQGKGAIPLPYGATKITVTNPDATVFDRLYLYFLNSKVAAETSNTHDSAKLILNPAYISISGESGYEVNLSSYTLGSSDVLVVTFYDTAGAAISDDSFNSIITIS